MTSNDADNPRENEEETNPKTNTSNSTPQDSTPSATCIQNLSDPTPSSQIGPVWHCTFSPTGDLLASCHGMPHPSIRIWTHSSSWHLSATLSGIHERTIRHASFSSTRDTLLASASFDGTVAVWQGDEGWEGVAQLEGHENEVKCVVWNGSDTLLASCGRDKTVWIWECLGVGEEIEFECLAVLHGHEGDVKHLVFTPSHSQWGDGEDILLSSSYDDTIKIWAEDSGDWYCASTLKLHAGTVWSMAVSSSGLRMVSGDDDGMIAVWRCFTKLEKRELIKKGEERPSGSSRDGLWKCTAQIPNAHKLPIYSVHCAPVHLGHSRILSGGADNTIHIYREISSETFLTEVSIYTDSDVNCVVWHPYKQMFVSGGDDGLVRVWRFGT